MTDYADFGISTHGKVSGNVKTTCPKCSHLRKKQGDPCLSLDLDKRVWNCHNCGWGGGLSDIQRGNFIPRRKYKRPEPPKAPALTQKAIDWLVCRGITAEAWTRNGLFSSEVWMPQTNKKEPCINFPFFRDGELVNVKHRDGAKNFTQEKDAEQILYGYDDINDDSLIWVEGEIDKLSIEVAGFQSCVSVPAGAPGENDKNLSKKFEFFESAKGRLDKVKKHIIAVDRDGPGFRLQEELIRRLGAENCAVVVWPDGCKDANDCLKKHGISEIVQKIQGAKMCPISGIVMIADIADQIFSNYEHGTSGGLSTGWACVDECYTVRPGEWTVVTGIPSHGKSEWLDALLLNLSRLHGWKFALFSPENQPLFEHAKKLLEKAINKPFAPGPTERMSPDEVVAGTGWLDERFCFIVPENPSLDEILDLGKKMVRRFGIQGMVVDPWNEIDHTRPASMTETEYVSHAISRFRRFARDNQVHLWLVAHPTKMKKDEKTKEYPVPTLYDISGSAHWRNKADNGITIFRHVKDVDKPVEIHIQKVRFKAVGQIGIAKLNYDRVTGRYKDPDTYFQESYLEKTK